MRPLRSRITGRRRGLAAALACALSLLALSVIVPASAGVNWFWTEIGRTGLDSGQRFEAVETWDQSGTEDNWYSYVEFLSGPQGHRSVFLMEPVGSGDTLTITINYRGPTGAYIEWDMYLVDQTNENWVNVLDNQGLPDWVWAERSTTITDAGRFLDADGHIVVVWQTADTTDASQLDYLKLSLSGDAPPVPPTTSTTVRPRSSITIRPVTSTTARPVTSTTARPQPTVELPPTDTWFDYQIGGAYSPHSRVGIVSRDWYDAEAEPGLYNICYVNAFQAQPAGSGNSARADLLENWPSDALLGVQDQTWDEEVIDIRSEYSRRVAFNHVKQMIDTCVEKGFDAVEFDNLDTYYRFPNFISMDHAVAYARMLNDYSHQRGLASAQKNSAELIADGSHRKAGFDFALVEQCSVYNECGVFADAYDNNVLAVEYRRQAFNNGCGNPRWDFPFVLVENSSSAPGVDPDVPRDFC